MEEKEIVTSECVPPEPSCRGTTAGQRAAGSAEAPPPPVPRRKCFGSGQRAAGGGASVLPGGGASMLPGSGASAAGSGAPAGDHSGQQSQATIPFSSMSWFSLLQIDVEVEEPETSVNPTQLFEIHNIV